MPIISLVSLIISLAVLFAYLNDRFIKLQPTIAIMIAALLLATGLLLTSPFEWLFSTKSLISIIENIDFSHLLLDGFLGILLFAGSLTLSANDFNKAKFDIGILAFGSTVFSTIVIGISINFLTTYAHQYWGFPNVPWTTCFLFGALISPTDPIAVLATLKSLKAPKYLSTRLAGESLFNDGIGVVLFLTLYEVAKQPSIAPTIGKIAALFAGECLGGITFGALLGYGAYYMIRTTESSELIVLITLALATGGYTLANALHVSGPLAMVVCGMFLGNKGQTFVMREKAVKALNFFWDILDEILNVLLFFLMGLELILINFDAYTLLLMGMSIPLVLFVRWLSVFIPIYGFSHTKQKGALVQLLTWGGLRGGLAIALVLSIPSSLPGRDLIFAMTYGIVVFSIVVQGSTVPFLLKQRKLLEG